MFFSIFKSLFRKRGKISNNHVYKRILSIANNEYLPQSVILFTTHKCASSFISNLLNALTENSLYKIVDYARAILKLGNQTSIIKPFQFLENNYSYFYKQFGEIYVPHRRPVCFPGIEKFKQIYFLRDPRDVLVSSFYSFSETHSPPINHQKQILFFENRKKIKALGIDLYSIENAKTWLKPIYQQYNFQKESAKSNHLYLSYDLFINDTEKFIKQICNFLNLSVSKKLITELTITASPVQNKIQSNTHKRSGKSRQFERELKPETINIINTILKEELDYWHFSI